MQNTMVVGGGVIEMCNILYTTDLISAKIYML